MFPEVPTKIKSIVAVCCWLEVQVLGSKDLREEPRLLEVLGYADETPPNALSYLWLFFFFD